MIERNAALTYFFREKKDPSVIQNLGLESDTLKIGQALDLLKLSFSKVRRTFWTQGRDKAVSSREESGHKELNWTRFLASSEVPLCPLFLDPCIFLTSPCISSSTLLFANLPPSPSGPSCLFSLFSAGYSLKESAQFIIYSLPQSLTLLRRCRLFLTQYLLHVLD